MRKNIVIEKNKYVKYGIDLGNMKFVLIYWCFVIDQILGKSVGCLFFEKRDEVSGVGKVEVVWELGEIEIGEEQVIFEVLEKRLVE